ncbi:hypothetical protein GWK47_023934 [Chionoecetes opilio]|uniref:PHD-type domain-containing protein n=1 Tax=Chionoecetes opilio TaxID=41210 RepID=A0A8J5CCR7_CHIOP|nr:hypothetical protein GWK47_023934 [Chionoecetes opilio]
MATDTPDKRMPPVVSRLCCCVCGKKKRRHPGVKLHLFPKDARRQPHVEGDCMIACDACQTWYHRDCKGISSHRWRNLQDYDTTYTCNSCRPEAGHGLPVVGPTPDEPVSGLLPHHCCRSLCHLLHDSFGALSVDRELRNLVRLDQDLLDLIPGQ